MNSKPFKSVVITACSLLLLSGCSSARSNEDQALIDSLTQKNQQLQTENEEMRSKLASQEALKSLVTCMTAPASAVRPVNSDAGAGVNCQAPSTAAPSHQLFTDLDNVSQKPMIDDLTKLGVFDDINGKFDPYKPITRGEYVTWLFRANNKILPVEKQIHMAPQAAPYFKDLGSENPAYPYVQALANAGYSVGYEDGTFRADKAITREEMIGMKVGVDCGKTFDPYRGQMAFIWKFSDSDKVDNRFTGYIHQDYYTSGSYGSNIARAFGKVGSFHPQQAVLRCEAAGTLWQVGQFEMQSGSAAKVIAAGAASG